MSARVINLTDPAFATIRKYRAAVDAFNAYGGDDDDEQNKKLEQALEEAQNEFERVVPTTPEGFRRKVAVHLEVYCGGTEDAMRDFFDTLCKSAFAIAGVAEVQS
jgi:hypothetical protein